MEKISQDYTPDKRDAFFVGGTDSKTSPENSNSIRFIFNTLVLWVFGAIPDPVLLKV
jgi:hypothetical protein